ncbi:MBL fold metallo-hydrolase [Comamonadaceae bacterium OH2545_COT-014]|nr:MBL fold metallo-hydrolase [Comamonadaceae bacterium OH2545_COT-014]
MPRPSQLLHPPRTPAPLLPAATLLLLRDGAQGLEVLMTRRHPAARFAPGAYVFPGGVIDAQDAAAHAHATRRAAQDDNTLTAALAAIRECFEEVGVLLARRADGTPATAGDVAALDRHAPLAAQCAARGLRLAAADVFWLARWLTDRDLPRRYDVPFFVAHMPAGQTPVADGAEQFAPEWVRPADALARHAAGQFHMIFPTIRTLERLRQWPDANAALAACAGEQPLWTSCPRAGTLAGREARYMEHEPPFGELALTCPDGQMGHALDWQSAQPVPLLKNVLRLTAPNPGFMTGPGTNSYLVGSAASGYIAIDPGPHDPAHLQRLWQAAGGDIRAIVCTHSHADHSPGAYPLQALCGGRPPVLGLPSQPTARPASRFTPQRALQDQELLTLKEPALGGEITHTLRVLHTPGHAANHVCLLLEEDGLLFSGDHILSGSTTVVDPPDGDMSAYLDSLDKLDAACAAHGVQFILPAHGHVMHEARATIARLKAHRLAREAKVLAALRALPHGTLDDWVAHAYADVPRQAWPVAKRSLLAHAQRLRAITPDLAPLALPATALPPNPTALATAAPPAP